MRASCALIEPTIMESRFGLKMVAGIEAAKGVLVLAAGLGLFELMHRDVQAGAERLVRNFHFNPASHYPRVFLEGDDPGGQRPPAVSGGGGV